jgi:membrane protease YdiL (CAAX protease family)
MIQQTTGNHIKWLFFLLILEIPFVFIAGQMQQFLFRTGLVSSKGHFTENLMQEYSPFIVAALVIVILPFFEELLFRLPLQFKKINFLPFIIYSNLVFGYVMRIKS